MRNLLLLTALIASSCAFGQQDLSVLNVMYNHVNLTSSTATTNATEIFFLCRNSIDKRVIGNPYLSRKWEDVLLVSNEGNSYQVQGRYRVFDDEFQILLNDNIKALFPHLIKGIVMGDRSFIPTQMETPSGSSYAFFEMLSKGDVKLLKRYGTDLKSTKGGYLKIGEVMAEYYYLTSGEIAKPLKMNRKNVLRVLGDRATEVKAYAKDHKLNLRSETDLRILFNYYNSL